MFSALKFARPIAQRIGWHEESDTGDTTLERAPPQPLRVEAIVARAGAYRLFSLRADRLCSAVAVSGMDLRQYVRLLHAHWAVIAASVIICTAAAAALAWTRTPIYTASTQLFVSTGGVSDPGQAYQAGLFTQQRVRSYAQIVSSPSVTQAVIQELGLRESSPQLQGRIRASVPTDTVLIDVTVKDGSPARAKAIHAKYVGA